ncbi:MAG: minor capsid protein [Alphaproteobacteria bacterium]|nr:minor capsid protein [Alphaproteobacteria bacterium]
MKTIDVSSQYVPNPKIIEIVKDDMKRHEEDYYIWRTEGDDKVRDAHAAREGHIYNWHIPPVGGHPGEDYNCRCWAEPFEFKKMKDMDMVDLLAESGADLTDEELLNLMASNLLETERMKTYIYLDKYGHITSGIGALLDDEKSFKNVPWKIGKRMATKQEVDEAYKKFVAKRFEKDDKGKYANHNRRAESFINDSPLRISKEYMIERMMSHLKEDLMRARLKRNDFDTYPIPLKLIILDFYYNKGSFYNQPGLPQALDAKDAKLFQEKMIRHMRDRDEWTKEQFNKIPQSFWNSY